MSRHFVRYLSCAAACAAALVHISAATAGGFPNQLLIPNPTATTGDLFGFRAAPVGADKIIIGAPGTDSKTAQNSGAAYLFDLNGTLLTTFVSPVGAPDESFGILVTAVGIDRVLITALQDEESVVPTLAGAAYLFDLQGTLLDTFANPNPSIGDQFGVAAALGTDALIIASPGDDTDGPDAGRAFLFDLTGKNPVQVFSDPTPVAGDSFGFPVAALGTDRFVIAAENCKAGTGELHVFDAVTGTLINSISTSDIVSSVVGFGAEQLLMGSEGTSVGKVPFAGAAFLFDIATGNLDLTIPNPFPGFDDAFGVSVAQLGGGTIAVGADLDNPGKGTDVGTVYLYDAAGTLLDTIDNPTPTDGDQFGFSLAAIGCNQLIVGAPHGDDVFKAAGPGEVWVLSELAGDCSNNFVELHLARIDEFDEPKDSFGLNINVVIPDEAGVTSVSVLTGGEFFILLQDGGNGSWGDQLAFADLASMRFALDGLWSIDVAGASPSTTEFTLSALALLESDFFAVPTGVTPADGSTDVPLDVVFTWIDPTGKQTADVVFVFVNPIEGEVGEQQDDSILGTLDITDTSWDPPQDLLPGPNRFGVGYANLDTAGLAGELTVLSGSIAWGNSPFAPPGYPARTPLLTFAGQTSIGFAVASGEVGFDPPEEFPAAGEPNHQATGDLDGDGTIDTVVTIPDLDPLLVGSVQVFLNQGNDKLGEWIGLVPNEPVPVGREPTGVAVGFFNMDAHLDVAVTNAGDNTVTVLMNQGTGDGTFGPPLTVPVGNRPSAIVTGQFNDLVDAFIDLAVTNELDENVVILFNDGAGNFSSGGGPASTIPPFGLTPVSMTTGDFDDNKCPDVAGAGNASDLAANGVPGRLFVLFGQGDGTFSEPLIIDIGFDPTDVSTADFNGDFLPDLVAANRGDATISVVLNLGGGAFATPISIPVGTMPRSIEAADLDADGIPDLAVVADDPAIGPSVQILINRTEPPVGAGAGPVVFDPPQAFGVAGDPNFVVTADLDGDGLNDLLTVNADDGPSGGSVSALINSPVPSGGTCLGDLNSDGVVNIADLFILLGSWGPCPPPPDECPADLDGDGEVGILDLLLLFHQFGACKGLDTCPWDLDGDGDVTFGDLTILFEHIGPCRDPLDCAGDFDGDGVVGILDILELLAHLGPCP